MTQEDLDALVALIDNAQSKEELEEINSSAIKDIDDQIKDRAVSLATLLKLTNPATFIAQMILLIQSEISKARSESQLLTSQKTLLNEKFEEKLKQF